MEKNIAVIWGDCSSPEIVKQTLRVLDKVAEKYGHTFHYTAAPWAARPLINTATRCPSTSWTSALLPTACCWAR